LTSIKPGLAGEKSPFKRKEKQKRKEKKDTQKSETEAQTNIKVFFPFFYLRRDVVCEKYFHC
jgi:hypothetical protein